MLSAKLITGVPESILNQAIVLYSLPTYVPQSSIDIPSLWNHDPQKGEEEDRSGNLQERQKIMSSRGSTIKCL